MGPHISTADTRLEQPMKKMLLIFRASCLGKHASDAHQRSNLHHFLDQFPLVSSEYSNSGASTIGSPAVATLRLCRETYCTCSYIIIINLHVNVLIHV